MNFCCKECHKNFGSKIGLGNHIIKNHNPKKYYDKWIKRDKEDICPVCNMKNKFRGLRDGYTKTCMICSKKIRFPSNKEYWIYRGSSDREAQENVKKFQIAQSKKVKIHRNDVSIDYYINKGFSKLEAMEKIKERQTTFSKKICIEKYGKNEGLKRWEKRQKNWQATLKKKSPEEKERINKLKGITLENMIRKWGIIDGPEKYNDWKSTLGGRGKSISKISQNLFFKILENIPDKNNVKFGKHNKEFFIKGNEQIYFYDFKYKNKIIEFNGDIFHANPSLYEKHECPNFYNKKLSAKEIWKNDKLKLSVLKEWELEYLVIWESDYIKNPSKVLNKCINFLNNE